MEPHHLLCGVRIDKLTKVFAVYLNKLIVIFYCTAGIISAIFNSKQN